MFDSQENRRWKGKTQSKRGGDGILGVISGREWEDISRPDSGLARDRGMLIYQYTMGREWDRVSRTKPASLPTLHVLGSIPMWPCLPQGESLPFSHFFVPCFSPDFQPCFELVFWQLLRNIFFLLVFPSSSAYK